MKYTTEVMQNTFAPIKKKNTFNSFDNEQCGYHHVQRKEHKSFRDMRKNKRNVWQGAE